MHWFGRMNTVDAALMHSWQRPYYLHVQEKAHCWWYLHRQSKTEQLKNRQNIAYLIANNTPISHIVQEVDTSIHPAHVSSKLCHCKTTATTAANAAYSCIEHQASIFLHVFAGQHSDWHKGSYWHSAAVWLLSYMQNIAQIKAEAYRTEN